MNLDELEKVSRDYAQSKGFLLQPNKEIRQAILNGLLMREQRFGKRYCPCRVITKDEAENNRIVCPCAYHEDEIKKDGSCKCKLFLRKGLKK